MSGLSVVKLTSSHYEGWLNLYKHYAEFYNTSLSNTGTKTTWGWLIDTNHPCTGIVVLEENLLVGLAHFREMPSPLRGANIGFLAFFKRFNDVVSEKWFREAISIQEFLPDNEIKYKIVDENSNINYLYLILNFTNYNSIHLYSLIK